MLIHLSIAYLLSNICTKKYWNRTTTVEIILGGCMVSFFETQCVLIFNYRVYYGFNELKKMIVGMTYSSVSCLQHKLSIRVNYESSVGPYDECRLQHVQGAANPQTNSTNLRCESACRLLQPRAPSPFIFNSSRELILMLLSHGR